MKKKEVVREDPAPIEQRLKYRNSLASQVQVAIDKLAEKLNELTEHDVQTYEMLHSPDSLYGDSPLGRAFTWEWVKQYMIKNNLDFVGYHLDGKVTIKEFTTHATEASNWAARFTKPSPAKKSGIDAIL